MEHGIPPAWFVQELLRIAKQPTLSSNELFVLSLTEEPSDGDIYEWVSKQK